MKLDSILEARKNQDVNKTDSPYEALKKYKDDSDVFISFTKNDIMGISSNKNRGEGRYGHLLPTCISGYSIARYWKTFFLKPNENIWHPGDSKGRYAWVIKPNGRFIKNVNDYTEKEFLSDIKKSKRLIVLYRKVMHHDPKYKDVHPLTKLWEITEMAAKNLAGGDNYAMKWNMILRNLGFSGFYFKEDSVEIGIKAGTSTDNEAIFLDKSAFSILERVDVWRGNKGRTPNEFSKMHINTILNNPDMYQYVERYISEMKFNKRDIPLDDMKKLEKIIASDAWRAYKYAISFEHKDKIPSDIILAGMGADAQIAETYVRSYGKKVFDTIPDVLIHGIARDPHQSYNYAWNTYDELGLPSDIILKSMAKNIEYTKDFVERKLIANGEPVPEILKKALGNET